MRLYKQYILEVLFIFEVLLVAFYSYCSYTSNAGFVYAQQQLSLSLPQPNKLGVKITSPVSGQQVIAGILTIFGISTDNSTTDCSVFADWNNLKPMQKVMPTGPGGENDYSSWTFTYTNKYHLITQGPNELTAKLSCVTGPFNSTKYYSVKVQGVSSSSSSSPVVS